MAETTQSPSTIVSDSSLTGVAWTNPSNAASSDNNKAECALIGIGNTQTEYLKATNFGFSIPTDATINGIELSLERESTSARVSDTHIKIVLSGSVSGNNKAGQTWPAVEDTYVYGGSSDMWGLSIDPSDVNASNFGCVVAGSRSALGYAYVNHVQLTIYYTLAGGSDVTKQDRYYRMMRS